MRTRIPQHDLKPFDIIYDEQDSWIGIYIDENNYIGYNLNGNSKKGTLFNEALSGDTYEVICNLKDVMISMKAQPLDDLQKGHGEYLFGVLNDGRVRLTLRKGSDITLLDTVAGIAFVKGTTQTYGHYENYAFGVIASMARVLSVLQYHHKYTPQKPEGKEI